MTISDKFEWEGVTGMKFGHARFGIPKMSVHVFYVDGLLIDTGHSNMSRIICQKIKELEVDQIFITHHHEDHTGNLEPLQNYFGCPTYAAPKTCEMMKNPPPISFGQNLTWGNRPPNHHLIPKSKIIKTPQYEFEIIPIPGHTVDQVALYERNQKWLFSADLFVNTYINIFLNSETFVEQIDSIEQILKLDFELLFCNHNPQKTGGKELLKQKLQFLKELYNNVKTQHKKTPEPSKIFRALRMKENWQIRFLTHGYLSKLNIVRAAVRDIEKGLR